MTDESDVVAPLQEAGECYACMVGVWTGPESHGEHCPMRSAAKSLNTGVQHVIRTGEADARIYWECSCGRAGSVDADWGDVDFASDDHINYAAGDRRVESSASLDAPWPQDATSVAPSEASPE